MKYDLQSILEIGEKKDARFRHLMYTILRLCLEF